DDGSRAARPDGGQEALDASRMQAALLDGLTRVWRRESGHHGDEVHVGDDDLAETAKLGRRASQEGPPFEHVLDDGQLPFAGPLPADPVADRRLNLVLLLPRPGMEAPSGEHRALDAACVGDVPLA